MFKILALIASLSAVAHVSRAALCGGTEYFSYTFKPLEITPTNPAEVESSKDVCGETHCDLIIALNSKPRCKKNDHSVILRAKENMNAVDNSHIQPPQTPDTVHSQWHLTEARNNPITVEVCDEDGTLQGRNDKILGFELQSIKRGCNTYDKTFSEVDQAHPWRFKYEICCTPINEEVTTAAPIIEENIECIDKKTECKGWRKEGQCVAPKYAKFMKKNCRKTCEHCREARADCSDKKKDCKGWKKEGQCTSSKYANFMKKNCSKTCGHCGGSTTECDDKKKDCKGWKRVGQCTAPKYAKFMKKNCPKTCGHCT